ncbi:MAG: sulfatase, partial [Lentisphaerae bacterium]
MSSERLNILWICTDSQRWDTLGCYGNPYVHTPNLDRLSKEGVIFDHCYAQNPLCTPSRGSFLTGRYPSCTALRDNGQNIRPSEVPVTKLLADAGWICGLSGKLHLSACNRRFQLGDTWWEYPNSFQVVQGCEPRIEDGYCDTEFHWDHSPVSWFRSSAYVRWVESQGKQIDYPPRKDFPDVKQGMPPELHQTFWCAQQAIHFIEAYKDHPTPWLFSVNIFDPHFPVNPPDAYFKRYLEFFDE